VTVFETETMAELCVKQGLVSEALALYRRLIADAPDELARTRRVARLSELERLSDGVRLAAARASTPSHPEEASIEVERRGDTLVVSWAVPAGTRQPALQILLMNRRGDDVEADLRTIPLDATSGTTTVEAVGLHSARAAVGWLDGARFVPLARHAAQGP
jgi:hypothetical protein